MDVSETFPTTGLLESQWGEGQQPLTPRLGSFSPLCSVESISNDTRTRIGGLAEFVIHGKDIGDGNRHTCAFVLHLYVTLAQKLKKYSMKFLKYHSSYRHFWLVFILSGLGQVSVAEWSNVQDYSRQLLMIWRSWVRAPGWLTQPTSAWSSKMSTT